MSLFSMSVSDMAPHATVVLYVNLEYIEWTFCLITVNIKGPENSSGDINGYSTYFSSSAGFTLTHADSNLWSSNHGCAFFQGKYTLTLILWAVVKAYLIRLNAWVSSPSQKTLFLLSVTFGKLCMVSSSCNIFTLSSKVAHMITLICILLKSTGKCWLGSDL